MKIKTYFIIIFAAFSGSASDLITNLVKNVLFLWSADIFWAPSDDFKINNN